MNAFFSTLLLCILSHSSGLLGRSKSRISRITDNSWKFAAFPTVGNYGPKDFKQITPIEDIENEIESYKNTYLPFFLDHRKRIEGITATRVVAAPNSLAELNNLQVFHFASEFDEIDQADSTNINDKLWRTALKFGKVIVNVGVESLQQVQKLNFEPDKLLYVSLIFSSFCIIRYVYKEENIGLKKQTALNVSTMELNYLEFQWLLFGKLVYKRIVNRKEIWKKLYQASDDGKCQVVFDVRNKNKEEEPYERLIGFAKSQ